MLRAPARCLVILACLSAMTLAEGASIWLDVPFVQQEKNGCGAAVLAMVMQYWQLKAAVSPGPEASEIQRVLYSRDAHGIYASAMQQYLNQRGFRTFAFAGQWDDLRQHLEKGRPLIVALRPGAASSLHYVVVAGLDEQHGWVLLNDPAQKKLLKQDRTNFEHEWNAAEKWTLLAVPQSGAR